MDEITVSAKTLDDAITEALIQLGVTSDQLDYDVIEKGSAGFLGIGMKQAVIKARRKVVKEDPVEEEIKEIKKEFHKKEFKKEEKPRFTKKETYKEVRKEKVSEPVEVKEIKELAKVEDVTIRTCEDFLRNVLKTMGMEVNLTSKVDDEGALSIDMSGENMGILIGKRGQTLDSLQYLTNRVANKMQSGYVRVKLDTEDYRRRRKETLENLAKNIAHKVKRTRRPLSLEPMNPYERRIIHSALQADRSVTTHSEGEEPYRRVVVTLVRR